MFKFIYITCFVAGTHPLVWLPLLCILAASVALGSLIGQGRAAFIHDLPVECLGVTLGIKFRRIPRFAEVLEIGAAFVLLSLG